MNNLLFTHDAVMQALDRMAEHIQSAHGKSDAPICLIGIHTGGANVADALQTRLEQAGATVMRGNLDISFYRDDLDLNGPHPQIHSSDLSFDINNQPLWLIDDVLFTGRTIRAAMGELFDFGRPESISLVVLLDRGGRELPIQADFSGLYHQPESKQQSIKLLAHADHWTIIEQPRSLA
ncbi:MAG: bifunctional pyr operon transcriptional regulator/uracil phosphoribosyltransferase PyrR [Zetaproteobacteria bacterium]|nr:bifunctional pyr operon transcriptional regulator/uracil phosphoribosyltransferase PyrR [Zetaproteobacteria bacterium]